MLNGKVILITGGTGSFGKKFVKSVFEKYNPAKVIIYSRDEYKQFVMKKEFSEYDKKIRYFIGNVRDKDRLYRAFDGVDYVIHAAALKQVPSCEYNPFEAIKTNIYGAQNIIDAAIDKNVKKVIALSTDKAVNPINLYGATKLASDKLFIAANAYTGFKDTNFSIVRYGNVAGSRGSVIPFFMEMIRSGNKKLPITDFRMTRFWINLKEAVSLIFTAINESKGGETYVSKIPSFKIVDLANALSDEVQLDEVGIREGEKLHEIMITENDSYTTYEYDSNYIIYPQFDWWNFEEHFTKNGKKVNDGYVYASNINNTLLSVKEIQNLILEI